MAISENYVANQPQNSLWYVAFIIILAAALAVWAGISLKVDIFTDALKQNDTVALLIVIDDGDKPLITEILLLNQHNHRGALIALPKETGMLLSAIDKVDRLEALYDVNDNTAYAMAVGELLDYPIDFTIRFHLDDFERFVDHLGGLDILISKAIDDSLEGRRYLFPPGGVRLDGAKMRSYVEYRPPDEHLDERSEREHRIVQALLQGIGENIHQLLDESVFPHVEKLIGVDFDQRALKSCLTVVSEIPIDRLVFQDVRGNRRILDSQYVLFPYYDGKLFKETIRRVLETLSRDDDFGEGLFTIRVEIQNGTTTNGLASRTAQFFESYGFSVVSTTNADRNDYERTIVIDRRGNPEATRRVAELIRCEQIHSRIDEYRDETIDVTVILGKDFGGRYVKK